MITLISPNVVVQRSDVFTTGIVYMPIGLASLAAVLAAKGMACQVIDAFGEAPDRYADDGAFMIRGLTPAEVAAKIVERPLAVVVYALNVTAHRAVVAIVRAVHARWADVPVVVMENTQAVTAYSVRRVQESLYDAGVDYVLTGEAEERGVALLSALCDGRPKSAIAAIDGIGFRDGGTIHYTPPVTRVADLDILPWPAWERFPLANYWALGYAHGPMETDRYLPLLTSRGCPYPCRFCVIPETNDRRWRARSARSVVDEMAHHRERFGVREFHVEDVDPTVDDARMREICHEIIRRDLDVVWKLAAGTKVETIRDEATVRLFARAGCRYISISPESGSPRVLKTINKPFDVEHAVRLVAVMNEVGIRSQACFVLGFPGEDDADRRATADLVRRLAKAGVDEIALFVITPMPGAAIADQYAGYTDYSELTFSPTWRTDYAELNRFRLALYRRFLLWKLAAHPGKVLRQALNFARGRFETKMEMTPYRALRTMLMRAGIGGTRVVDAR